MGRKIVTKNMTDEEKLQYKKDYHKKYYQEYKAELMTSTVVTNSIDRLIRSDDFIKQLIERVGVLKMSELINEYLEEISEKKEFEI